MALTFLTAGADSSRQVERHRESYRVSSGAEGAITVAADQLWTEFRIAGGGTPGRLDELRTFLDGRGLLADAGVGTPEPNEGVDIGADLALGESATGRGSIEGAVVDEVRVVRRDLADSTQLYMTATVRPRRGERLGLARQRRSVQQVFTIEGGEWPGLDFALLANNLNCAFCHMDVDNAERVYNTDPSKYGTFDRIKVGSLDSMRLRSSSETNIFGTLYSRGIATLKDGTPITNWSGMDIKSVDYDADGKVIQDIFGDVTPGDLVPAGDPPLPLQNLYLGYDSDTTTQVDGYMPETFPNLFPDDGGIDPATGLPTTTGAGNRKIDPGEFAAASAESTGSLSGGTIHVTDATAPIANAADLTTALSSGNQASLGSVTDGSVILVGTELNPIQLDGIISIDGDVVIQGYVKGTGSIVASGNVYLPTDVRYLDDTPGGARRFGTAVDGTPNSLALAAGGSIIAGDLYGGDSPATVTGDESGEFSFVLSEISIFNRREWAKTQPLLPGQSDDPDDPTTWSTANPSFSGAGYVPRYYSLDNGGTVPIFNKAGLYFDSATNSWMGPEHEKSWDTSAQTLAYPSDPTDPLLFHADGTPKAAVQSLTTRGDWLSQEMLSKLMQDAEASHDPGEALRVDALLYSANSIYGLVKKASNMDGRMIVNGAILAPDMGMLVANGLRIHFDKRPSNGLPLVDQTGSASMRRSLWLGVLPGD